MCEVYELPTNGQGHCEDCGSWDSARRDGLCRGCQHHARNWTAQVYSIARAARGDDMDPLDGGPDDPPPAA